MKIALVCYFFPSSVIIYIFIYHQWYFC